MYSSHTQLSEVLFATSVTDQLGELLGSCELKAPSSTVYLLKSHRMENLGKNHNVNTNHTRLTWNKKKSSHKMLFVLLFQLRLQNHFKEKYLPMDDM